jgi:hypothetical protein
MSNLNKREHDYFFPLMIVKYGNFCYLCQKTPLSQDRKYYCKRLLIHEIKYERPLKLENMRPMCDSCNQEIHPPKPEVLDEKQMKPELKINREKEPKVRQYIINRILLDGECDYNKLVAAAAEKISVSTKTVETYMDKLTSDEGKLIETFGTVYLRGYEPKMKYDLMTNTWITEIPPKTIPSEIVKEIQDQLEVSRKG